MILTLAKSICCCCYSLQDKIHSSSDNINRVVVVSKLLHIQPLQQMSKCLLLLLLLLRQVVLHNITSVRLFVCLLDFKRDSGDFFNPRLVEGHPHVDPWQVRVGALDPVGNSSGQNPTFVLALHHQRAAAVTLKFINFKIQSISFKIFNRKIFAYYF